MTYKTREESTKYDTKHGSPYDRGSADYYYGRGRDPHYYPNGTGNAPRVKVEDMTQAELDAYHAGYEEETDRKQWF
jgi:hypothetical protein